MGIVVFILILLVLVVGHEFGHFIFARIFRMRVPEFGVGFPPRLWAKKIGETEYSFNALLFGGFVKIYGEDSTDPISDPDAFSNKPLYAQALTLLAGPAMNLLIACVISSFAFMIGVPAAVGGSYPGPVVNPRILVTEVLPGSPAQKAGIEEGDALEDVSIGGHSYLIKTPAELPPLIEGATGPVGISLMRGGTLLQFTLSPEAGVVPGAPQTKGIGIATDLIGTLRLSFFSSIAAGVQETGNNIAGVVAGIVSLISSAFTFSANLSTLAGPVGIASLVGTATTLGWGSVLAFAALISVNLGILNLFPFPALDGGRLALILIEVVSGRKVPARYADMVNFVGFTLIILLLLVVTVHDISRLIG